ncbi:MAG: hypothetical protein OEM19_01500, partial [Deltaproteobacteria bacterium]|nr:hypothetical protein [Deltaproteobacteria bacterium]
MSKTTSLFEAVIIIAVILLPGVPPAHSSEYPVTPIDVPGAIWTKASGINDDGTIVGTYGDKTGTHGFLYDGISHTPLDVPGSVETSA